MKTRAKEVGFFFVFFFTYFERCSGVTCRGHGEQQQCGGVERLSCHQERTSVGVGAHRLRRPAEGEHQAQSAGADSHQEGENRKYPLRFQGWETQSSTE